MIKYDLYDEAIIGPALIWRDQQQVRVLVYDAEKIAYKSMEIAANKCIYTSNEFKF